MLPPPGLLPTDSSQVCRLHKSLYGLKQVSRQWHNVLSTTLLSLNFKKSSLFAKYRVLALLLPC